MNRRTDRTSLDCIPPPRSDRGQLTGCRSPQAGSLATTPLRMLPLLAALLCTGTLRAADPPTAQLDNGSLHVTIDLPDATSGFYRGTRFDWSGVIASLTYGGHRFYGPWFTKTDPSVRDFVFRGDDIVAGNASAITGPAEEFLTADNAALGFSSAAPGGTFVKIGVGVLRRPDDAKYSSFRNYEVVDGGHWTVKTTKTSARFTQRILDPRSGYGYVYTKTIRLLHGQPRLSISHNLRNIGRLPIETDVFNHNFLVLDGQTTGPDFAVTVPFDITAQQPVKAELGAADGHHVTYLRALAGREVFMVHIAGFRPLVAADNSFRVENTRLGAGVAVVGDRPLQSEALWSTRSVLAMEPFVRLQVAPGASEDWSFTYTYFATTPGSPVPRGQH